MMAKKKSQGKKAPVHKEGIDELEQFIKKKKNQNKVLRKIIEKLNDNSDSVD